ncbi:TetR/AcrR family transcriptional regulator [Actinosynnema sp. NPDC020468]|uniref:TetR/AcrR family transcriptional regulator n=1 Tax=Actinosynnema sp. NPDC020468 TaxID=3154488 RepID=UPI0034036E9D
MTSIVRRPLTPRQVELLGRLEALVLSEGFAHLTLDDLAARLHCSKSTLYTLAASKEQLSVRVVGRYFKGAAERIETRIGGIEDVRTRIGTYLAGAAEELRRASAQFITDVSAFAPTRTTYERNARAAAERIREFIQDGVKEGVFRDVHASLIAEMAGLLIEGIQTGVLTRRARVSDAEAFTALGELLLDGLRRERSQA